MERVRNGGKIEGRCGPMEMVWGFFDDFVVQIALELRARSRWIGDLAVSKFVNISNHPEHRHHAISRRIVS